MPCVLLAVTAAIIGTLIGYHILQRKRSVTCPDCHRSLHFERGMVRIAPAGFTIREETVHCPDCFKAYGRTVTMDSTCEECVSEWVPI